MKDKIIEWLESIGVWQWIDGQPIIVVVVFGLFAVVNILSIIYSIIALRIRQKAFRREAAALGFTYSYRETKSAASVLRPFRMNERRDGVIRHVMEGDWEGVHVVIGDYRHRDRNERDKSSDKRRQTFVAFRTDKLEVPEFILDPESILHHFADAFLGDRIGPDIDMASHPNFSKSYDLRAADEAAIREVFHAGVLEYFEAHPGLTVKVLHQPQPLASRKVHRHNLPQRDGVPVGSVRRLCRPDRNGDCRHQTKQVDEPKSIG